MLKTRQLKRLTPESHETLLTILETLPGALFVLDDAATILYANASAQALTGVAPETLVGNSFWRCAPQVVSTALYQAIQKTKQTRALTEVQYVSPVTGSWLRVHLSPTSGGLTLQFHEMGAPVGRQEIVPQRESLYMNVLENVHAGFVFLTPEGIVLDLNGVPLDDAQIRREEVVGKPLVEGPWWSSSPDSQAQLRAAIARASKGETVRFEAPIHPREGREFHLDVAITPHRDVDHHVDYLVIAGIDITACKRAEAELHALIDAIPQLVWTMRPDGSLDYSNQRWLDYSGLSIEQAQGDGWIQCLHPDDQQRIQDAWQVSRKTGIPFETEQRLRQGTTGTYRWFLARAMPVRDEAGQIVKWFGTCTDIDEQKRAEQQLEESRESLRVLAETVPQLVWVRRPDGQREYVNQRWRDYTGLTLEHVQSDPWAHFQFIHPDDREGNQVHLQHALDTGDMYEHEERLRKSQTGEYRWFLTRAMPMRDEAGQILKWFGTSTDIHEKKQAEDQIRNLIDAIPQLVWIARPDGYVTYHNQRLIDYLAMTQEQAEGTGWLAGVHPDDRQRVWRAWQTSIQAGGPYEVEMRAQDGTSGTYRWFLVRGVPQRSAQGTILHWVGTCTDIEDQKRVEQQLKESRESLRVLAETVPQLVWTARPDGLHEYTNQRWRDYTGLALEQIQSDIWAYLQAVHPDDREGSRAHWQHALETGAMLEHELRLRKSQTGEYRWFLARGMPMRDEAGQIVKWFGTSTDIEDQKRTEEALRQSQERANVLMNSNIIGINVIEGEQIVDANDTFLRMIGSTREDLHAGRLNWIHMTAPEDLARTRQAHQEMATQQALTPYEKEYICQDGSRLPVLVGGVLLQHHPSQAIGFALDNSARKELEQRKDAFISMASHELRTPLTALKLQTTLLHRQLARHGTLDHAPALSRMETQIKTITRLVEELLDVSKIQAGRLEYIRETVDLDALLREIVDTMQQSHPSHRILVRGAVRASLIGDRDRLGQVFTNLLSNAIKYSPDAQTVEMDLSASDEAVTIRVRDYGLGIPRELRDKIFERFYRVTDPKQKRIAGLGMGLYIVAEIVKSHGGTITVDSEVGKGSTFTVTLPTRRET